MSTKNTSVPVQQWPHHEPDPLKIMATVFAKEAFQRSIQLQARWQELLDAYARMRRVGVDTDELGNHEAMVIVLVYDAMELAVDVSLASARHMDIEQLYRTTMRYAEHNQDIVHRAGERP